jgi:3-hydroxyisobutyrate dehydrogenase-like beta-hydroxyacid dehydrogenase
MRVGFIGLGGMGKHIAERIVDAGHALTVHDIREQPINELIQYGAKAANSPKEVAAVSEIVISSLPSNESSIDVALSENGVLAGAKEGDIYIDTSTISPHVIRQVAAEAEKQGISVMDAPVSGGITQREEGSLTVMVGGAVETLEKARPILESFGGRIFHTGAVGTGTTVKLINNLTLATNQIAAMEAMTLGAKAGIEVSTLQEVISVSSGASSAFNNMIHNVMTESTIPPKGNKPTRGLHTLVKDTALASELARELSVPLLAGSVATQAYRSCEARGWLEHEHWAVMQIFEELANIRVRPEHL